MRFLENVPIIRIAYRQFYEMSRPAPLQEFDDYDEYWRSRTKDGLTARVLDRHIIIEKSISDGESVLDIGCGDGAFLIHLKKNKPSCRVLGLDASEAAINHLKLQSIDAIHLPPAARFTSVVSGQWNVITMMEVIEHVPDAERLVREAIQMNPSRIFITVPNVGCLKHRMRLMFGGRFPITTIIYHMKEHLRFWTPKDFDEWAKTLGLQVNATHGQFVRGDEITKFFIRKFPRLFAAQIIYECSLRT